MLGNENFPANLAGSLAFLKDFCLQKQAGAFNTATGGKYRAESGKYNPALRAGSLFQGRHGAILGQWSSHVKDYVE